jgi:hypothetical protein
MGGRIQARVEQTNKQTNKQTRSATLHVRNGWRSGTMCSHAFVSMQFQGQKSVLVRKSTYAEQTRCMTRVRAPNKMD